MKLGLDVNGGSYVLAEADFSTLPSETDTDEAMEGAKDIIERRVNAFGVSETEVTREGKNRLVIQLPGIAPEEAGELIGKTALLEFREPTLNEQQQIICTAPDGSEFPVDKTQVSEGGSAPAPGRRNASAPKDSRASSSGNPRSAPIARARRASSPAASCARTARPSPRLNRSTQRHARVHRAKAASSSSRSPRGSRGPPASRSPSSSTKS